MKNQKTANTTEKKVANKGRKNETKEIIIIGDSIVKDIKARDLSESNNIKIRKHSGASTLDMIDHIKPEARSKPDILLIHSCTNDFTKGVNTMK